MATLAVRSLASRTGVAAAAAQSAAISADACADPRAFATDFAAGPTANVAKAAMSRNRAAPFFVVDLAEVARRHAEWSKALPCVRPFYAVKCNPDRRVLETLAALGAGFDCASVQEVALVRSLGVPAHDIIYANPCKEPAQLREAVGVHGVQQMTFDSEEELYKARDHSPQARLLLRLAVDDSAARCRLSNKFGAPPDRALEYLQLAHDLGLNVEGVSFHVGSGGGSAAAFEDAVATASAVFDGATAHGLAPLRTLDVGGGFPGVVTPDIPDFDSVARRLSGALERYFPAARGVELIAEPGRFLVDSSCTLHVCVIARKGAAGKTSSPMYFVNDSIYSSFNCIMYDHATVVPEVCCTAAAVA